MVKIRDIRKGFILLFCLMLLWPTNVGLYTPVVLGEEIQQPEDNQLESQANSQENNDILITILEPFNRSSFNVNEILLGIKTENTGIEQTSIIISQGEEIIETIIAEDGSQQVPIQISNYNEGIYQVQALLIKDGSEYSSNTIQFEIDGTPPDVEVTSPTKHFINDAMIVGQTESGIRVFLTIEEEVLETVSDQSGQFSFDLNEYVVDGNEYKIVVNAEDQASNIGQTEVTFNLDLSRPYISPELQPSAQMSQAPVDTIIRAKIVDDNPIIEELIPSNAIEVFETGSETPILGTISFDEETSFITFTPSSNLEPSKKYYILINHMITDQAGNLVHARNWSFTTKSNVDSKNPHGNYEQNTNTCKSCHNTHVASKNKLIEPEEEIAEKLEQLEEPVTSYCMACHDGTVASKMPEVNGHSNHNNKELILTDGSVQTQSCGSCHDVHLGWHETNPNLIKDHFIFDHNGVEGGEEIGVIDSSIQLCESCHEKDSLSKKVDERVTYSEYSYSNWNNNQTDLRENEAYFGKEEDYTLCLRCHNSEVKENNAKVKDIQTFYSNSNQLSGHFITNDRVKDGSFLDGHLPCAECHDTHGSRNISLLKGNIGHNKATEFEKLEDSWTTRDVRKFCQSCHNNNTEVYGITVKFNNDTEESPWHAAENISCAICHGGTSRSFIQAVHSPYK